MTSDRPTLVSLPTGKHSIALALKMPYESSTTWTGDLGGVGMILVVKLDSERVGLRSGMNGGHLRQLLRKYRNLLVTWCYTSSHLNSTARQCCVVGNSGSRHIHGVWYTIIGKICWWLWTPTICPLSFSYNRAKGTHTIHKILFRALFRGSGIQLQGLEYTNDGSTNYKDLP